MNIQHMGVKRPTLSAVYAGHPGRPPIKRRPLTLSGPELRRIVANLVD